jgi:hypothetical protein
LEGAAQDEKKKKLEGLLRITKEVLPATRKRKMIFVPANNYVDYREIVSLN